MRTSSPGASSRSTRGDARGLRPCYGFIRVFIFILHFTLFYVTSGEGLLVVIHVSRVFLLFFLSEGYFCNKRERVSNLYSNLAVGLSIRAHDHVISRHWNLNKERHSF